MTPRVVAVIVHWQDPLETLGCVESVATERGVRVLVVDNGTLAPVEALLAQHAPDVRYLRSPHNRGYAGGANLGLRAALTEGAEVVLLLNDDVRLRPGASAAACRALAADARIAVVGPKVLQHQDPTRLWLAWGRVTWRQSLVGLCGAGARDGPRWSRPRDVPWVAGCAMWFSRSALEAVGLLDERFFAYHEEVDWCTRARRAGWRVRYCPEAVVTHRGRGSHGSPQAIRIRKYFAARNTMLFARKHGGPIQWVWLSAWLALSVPLQGLWHWSRGRHGDVGLKLRGIRDGLLERRPPFEALGLRGSVLDDAPLTGAGTPA